MRTLEEVERLRSAWSAWPGSRDGDIDVFLTVLRKDPAIQRPHILLIEEDGQPVALMAGRIVRKRLAFRFGYFRIFSPLVDVMAFPFGSLRGNSSSPVCEQLVREIVRGLRAGEADLAFLEAVDSSSNLYRCARRVPGLIARDHFAAHRYHRKRILPTSVDALDASLSSHQRKRFRQIDRKLNDDFSGQVRIDRLRCLADLDHSLRVVEEISKKTWQGKSGHGLNGVGCALRGLFELEARKSWLRVYTLYLAGRPCAFWIGTVYEATFYADFAGFDPEYSNYSPGMYLLHCMLEELCVEGVKSIDFGSSEEEYKKRFGNAAWQEASLHIFAPTAKGFVLNAMKAIAFLLYEPARSLLAHTHLIQRVKKTFRRIISDKQHSEAEMA